MRPVRFALILALAAAAFAPAGAFAQPISSVQVEALRAPDIFTTAAAETGLGADLWAGTSADIARTVAPLLSRKPLSPAAQGLALRLMQTGAPAPAGAEKDLDLAAARSDVLIALGDAPGAARVLGRQPGVATNAALSRAAAELALLLGDEDGACRIEQALTTGRDGIYWLRLRSWCQLRAGDAEAAQLTFNLAQGAAKDAVYGRLMAAKLAGVGPPPKPAFRNGLDRAMSKTEGAEPPPPLPTPVGVTDTPQTLALLAAASGDRAALDDLFARALSTPGKDGLALRGGVLVLLASGAGLQPEQRAAFAAFDLPRSVAPPARLAAMTLAAEAGLKGETALLALAVAADSGVAGPGWADRAAVIAALRKVGLTTDAKAFATEALATVPLPAPPAVR